jgi:hypothetical protein
MILCTVTSLFVLTYQLFPKGFVLTPPVMFDGVRIIDPGRSKQYEGNLFNDRNGALPYRAPEVILRQ